MRVNQWRLEQMGQSDYNLWRTYVCFYLGLNSWGYQAGQKTPTTASRSFHVTPLFSPSFPHSSPPSLYLPFSLPFFPLPWPCSVLLMNYGGPAQISQSLCSSFFCTSLGIFGVFVSPKLSAQGVSQNPLTVLPSWWLGHILSLLSCIITEPTLFLFHLSHSLS